MLIVKAKRVITAALELPILDGAVLVDAGKIVDVGSVSELEKTAGPNAKQIDLGTRTVLPGLFDSHVHLGFDGGPDPVGLMKASSDEQQLVLMLRSARELLRAGVTTARDLGARGHLALVVQEALATGMADGPEILVANEPVTTTGGHCWFMGGEADGRDEVRRAVRERHKAGANLVKVMSTGGFMTAGSAPWHAQFALDELQVIVEEASRVSMPVAAHAHGTPGIRNAVEAGVTTLEHCSWVGDHGLPGEAYAEDVVERIVEKGIRVCCTTNDRLKTIDPTRRAASMRRVGLMHDAGVKFIAGTDSGINFTPHGSYAGGLEALEACGLTRTEILTAATTEAASAFGLGERKGALWVGMDADMVAVAGNPLDDLSVLWDVSWVMRAGRAIEFPHIEESGASR